MVQLTVKPLSLKTEGNLIIIYNFFILTLISIFLNSKKRVFLKVLVYYKHFPLYIKALVVMKHLETLTNKGTTKE